MTSSGIGLAVAVVIAGSCSAFAQQPPTGKDLLGKARNLNVEELLKPYNATTNAPSGTPEFRIERPLTPAEVAARELKRRAEYISYSSLARSPSTYVGRLVTLTGRVIQAVENYGHVTLRVNVTRGQYDSWDDTIYVEYKKQSDSELRVLEKDIVAVWGKFEGIKSYTTVLGATMQIPYISAILLEHTSAPPIVITGPGYHRGR